MGATITVPTAGPAPPLDDLSRALALRLEQEKAQDVSIGNGLITFYGPPIFGTWGNWHLLLPVDSGRLTLASGDRKVHLHYKVGFTRLLVLAAIVTGGLAFLAMRDGFPGPRFIFLLGFGFLFGGNLVIALPRLHHFFRRSLQQAVTELAAARAT